VAYTVCWMLLSSRGKTADGVALGIIIDVKRLKMSYMANVVFIFRHLKFLTVNVSRHNCN